MAIEGASSTATADYVQIRREATVINWFITKVGKLEIQRR
jgi:hypothetical protein